MTPCLEKLNLHACDEFELHMPVECPKLIELKLKGSKVSNLNLGLTPNLQRLYLADCNCLKEIHAPVGCLKKLVYIRLYCCLSFVHFWVDKHHELANLDSVATFIIDAKCEDKCPLHPENDLPKFGFECEYDEPRSSWSGNIEKLISFGLCACKNLEDLSASICGLQYLRELKLTGSIPGDLWQLQSLEKLDIRFCSSLQDIPNSICKLKCLRRLDIYRCDQVEKLPEELGCLECLECLEELDLSDCSSLQHIPNSICKLKCLRRLNFAGCLQVERLPVELGCLEWLEELDLSYCRSLQDIPNSICNMKCLRRLDLSYCYQIERLPEELGCLECLEELNLWSCESLRHIPNSICNLKCLKHLNLCHCILVEKLPEELGCLECLEVLYLRSCKSLRHIPNSICNLKCLKSLNLSKCVQVEKLPEELGCLECLKELDTLGAGITRLPQSIHQLKGLRIVGSRELLQSYDFTSLTSSDSEYEDEDYYYAEV